MNRTTHGQTSTTNHVSRPAMLLLLLVFGFALASCGGPPQALKQPSPPTMEAASSELVSLLTFSAVGTADPVVGAKWLTWREQVHAPDLTWSHRRIRIDWPVEVGFRSAGRLGWRVQITLARSDGIDPALTAADESDRDQAAEPGKRFETVTQAEFILPTATEAGRLRAAWLRLAGGPAVPNLE
jgi:hypothetical protein